MESEAMSCFTILMADDDPDDRLLMNQAFRDIGICGEMRFVEDGEELMNYLCRSGKYADPVLSPRPRLILLDLNMPKKSGYQALLEIKANPDLEAIPVAIWTTSDDMEDKLQCQNAGADAYVTKPLTYIELVTSARKLFIGYGKI